MALSDDERENMKKAEEREKQRASFRERFINPFFNALIEKIRGKSIRKQLAFLLEPETIETSSRLRRNEIMACNQADWLGRYFHRFKPLRDFWIGVTEDEGLFIEGKGGGFARFVISEGGKGREESIAFVGASKEEKIFAPLFASMKSKEKD